MTKSQFVKLLGWQDHGTQAVAMICKDFLNPQRSWYDILLSAHRRCSNKGVMLCFCSCSFLFLGFVVTLTNTRKEHALESCSVIVLYWAWLNWMKILSNGRVSLPFYGCSSKHAFIGLRFRKSSPTVSHFIALKATKIPMSTIVSLQNPTRKVGGIIQSEQSLQLAWTYSQHCYVYISTSVSGEFRFKTATIFWEIEINLKNT